MYDDDDDDDKDDDDDHDDDDDDDDDDIHSHVRWKLYPKFLRCAEAAIHGDIENYRNTEICIP